VLPLNSFLHNICLLLGTGKLFLQEKKLSPESKTRQYSKGLCKGSVHFMISKQQQKYIQSLHNKKNRSEYGQFIVEGEKGLSELLVSDFEIVEIFCSESFAEKYKPKGRIVICSTAQIESITTFKSNTAGVAVVKQKRNVRPENFSAVTLFLDNINDPGNLGTIIRLADWYGVSNIVCSLTTVEFYNPKVISSTMGSFTRVSVFYTDLEPYLKSFAFPVYGADLDGVNVHTHQFEEKVGLVVGSESHGISPEIENLLTQKITIPRIGHAESLNAGMATGIVLDNIFRHI
jgi:TrmH family RNA methyltransferase